MPGAKITDEVGNFTAVILGNAASVLTPLYRTSLKGDRIVLAFISPQVGERFRAILEELEEQLGWPLQINPHPNQGQTGYRLVLVLDHRDSDGLPFSFSQ